MKEKVAEEIAARVKDGDVLGIGTGSTVTLAVQRIGERMKREGITVCGVPTSIQTASQCEALGVRVLHPGYRGEIAWGFDGADAVDPNFWLVKGKGGALLQEKILAARCREFIVIVDDSKLAPSLSNIPIPVEVVPEAQGIAERGLQRLGASLVQLRPCTGGKHGPIITEAGNVILDATFPQVSQSLEDGIKTIVGVVESGLFTRFATELWVGSEKGVTKKKRNN
jgi:ribose 5-phosphate isomerase A